MINSKTIMLVVVLTTIVSACDKKQPEPEPIAQQPIAQQPVDVLNANSGYSSIYDYIQNMQGVGSNIGSLNLADFTVEGNSTLHYVRNSG